jgi:hypothetical protein
MLNLADPDRKVGRVDMVYNTTLHVEAPLELAFWTVFDYPAWQGYETIVHVAGPKGEVGELATIEKTKDEPGWHEKFCKTIKLDPLKQIIWRVYTGPGQVGAEGWEREFDVTVDYRFEATAETTTIHMQVIKEFFVPYEDESELAGVQQSEYQHQVEIMEHLAPRLDDLLTKKKGDGG